MSSNGIHKEPACQISLKKIILDLIFKNYQPETALLRFRNKVLLGMENQCLFIVIMFDLSAAFDTIDHAIMFSDRFGIHCIGMDSLLFI